jgi:predicted nucleotidyltransferase
MTNISEILVTLSRANVSFVVIGGVAGIAHGAARVTFDLDIVYGRSKENVDRLVRALAPHHPYLRGAPPGLPFTLDVDTVLHGLNFTLTTDLGDLDLLGEVIGGGDYEKLATHSREIEAFGVKCRCVTLLKLIDLKRAAGRPKDFEAIAELELLRDKASVKS